MRRTLFVMTLLAAFVLLAGSSAFAQAPATWSVTDCQACHEKALGPSFEHSKHAKIDQSCASCHQNVGEHAKAQMNGDKNGPVPSVKKLAAKAINDSCLTCHEKGNQAGWAMNTHARRNVACTSCHSIHDAKSAKAQLKTKADPETCYTCHKTQRALSMRTSHHPVREGKMGCSSCHNPHEGNRPSMLKEDTVNELCYQCHTEKRGPFLFEHAPVRDNCLTCHRPHGSNHDKLLTVARPFQCQQCHEMRLD